MSQVFAPAVEGVILLAVVYALTYGGAGMAIYYVGRAIWRRFGK